MSGYTCNRLLGQETVPKERLFVKLTRTPLQLIIGLRETLGGLAKSELQLPPLLV